MTIFAKEVPYLSPKDALSKMQYPKGFKVTLASSEPQIIQPIAFCFDARGRIWVVENINYQTRRSHEKKPKSRISILEDTNGDGNFDKKKVFLEDQAFISGIAVGFGGVWLGAPPYLTFVPDKNLDDIADGKAVKILEGWGIQDRHETLNSFVWGPDGWLYGCQGVFTHSKVKNLIHPKDKVEPMNGGVWRLHPITKKFEVFAHGLSNPWGIDFNKHGQLFATACVIPHLWHVVQGGVYQRQSGHHYNPYVYQDLQTVRDHFHKSAHGGAIFYQADLFPEKYHDHLFMNNIHQHMVLSDIVKAKGSSFVGSHGEDFIKTNDHQWIGFNITLGPEGGLYILDWHDSDICGKKVLHPNTGRIFRVVMDDTKAYRQLDLNKLSDEALVKMQEHKNIWYVRVARTILQQRAAEKTLNPNTIKRLWSMFAKTKNEKSALRILWTLHCVKGINSSDELKLLNHHMPYVRAWAIQLMSEDHSINDEQIKALISLSKNDISPVVRLYITSALMRLSNDIKWQVIPSLLSHANDNSDHNLPSMYWFLMEPLVAKDPQKALAITGKIKINHVLQSISRRILSLSTNNEVKPTTNKKNSRINKKSLKKAMAKIAPGFNAGEIGKHGFEYLSSFKNKEVLKTHPINRNTEFYLWRELKLKGKKRLEITVSHHPHGDFSLVVKINNDDVYKSIISHKSVKDGWQNISIDLSKYQDKNVHIRIENHPNDWKWEYAYFHSIKIK